MFKFLKKKPARKMGQIELGLDLKRCIERPGNIRPCEVDGQFCRFHRWVEEEKALLHINIYERPQAQEEIVRRFREEGVFGPGCSVEKVRTCQALIEWPDGSVSRVDVMRVRFLDRKEG